MKKIILLVLTLSLTGAVMAQNPRVEIVTSEGSIVLELFADKAPVSVQNFLKYVKSGHYNGTIFHRVIGNFMIQGGGYTESLNQKPTMAPIKNEANNGLKNNRYTVAMARTMEVNSATSQFFINVVDNDFLNFSSATAQGYGYAVFGKVVKGTDTVERIRNAKTGSCGAPPFNTDCPQKMIKILSARQL